MSDTQYYRVSGYDGVAWRLLGPDVVWTQEYDEEECFSTMYEQDTGMVKMVMVGDDRVHIIDPDDLTPIREDEFCHECGQIGCGHSL